MIVPNALLRMARVGLGISQKELSRKSGVSTRSILRMELNERVTVKTIESLVKAFEAEGFVFLPAADGRQAGLRIPAALALPMNLRF